MSHLSFICLVTCHIIFPADSLLHDLRLDKCVLADLIHASMLLIRLSPHFAQRDWQQGYASPLNIEGSEGREQARGSSFTTLCLWHCSFSAVPSSNALLQLGDLQDAQISELLSISPAAACTATSGLTPLDHLHKLRAYWKNNEAPMGRASKAQADLASAVD